MTLALLLTAVTGAWADDLSNKIWKPGDTFNIGAAWLYDDDKGTSTVYHSIDEDNTVPAINDWTYDSNKNQWKIPGFIKVDKVDFSGDVISLEYSIELYLSAPEGKQTADVKPIGFKIISGAGTKESPYTLGLVYEEAPAVPDVEVTTNAASEGATFTEATFAMPAFDATAEYELVRDMSVQMTATMGDGTDGVRYRVKKNEQNPDKYEPADMNMMQVLTLVAVNDGIEHKALTLDEDYFCRIYKLDEQTLQPEGDGVKLTDFDFAPGLYALKAFAKVGSDYDGETDLSNTFQLFQGYEITVPAGEFATFYKDEPLRIEDQEADLYTIQSVSADQAVLSSPSDAMPALTPMLIYNKSQQEKVILLIPCNDPDLALTVAPEFKGTLTATTIAASTANQTNYAFNGKQFVWVKDAINLGANKAWLSIENANARAINIVFDETTGLKTVDSLQFTVDGWYTVDGRKLQGKPTKKGMYILNGKKVVVK